MRLVLTGGSLRAASLNARLLRHLQRQLEVRNHLATAFTGDALRLPLYEEALAPSVETVALDAEGAPTDARTAASLPKILDGFLTLAAKLR